MMLRDQKKYNLSLLDKEKLMTLDPQAIHNKVYGKLAPTQFILRDEDLREKMKEFIPYLASAFEDTAVEVLTDKAIYTLIEEDWKLLIIAENIPSVTEKFKQDHELREKMDKRFEKLLDIDKKEGSLELC